MEGADERAVAGMRGGGTPLHWTWWAGAARGPWVACQPCCLGLSFDRRGNRPGN